MHRCAASRGVAGGCRGWLRDARCRRASDRPFADLRVSRKFASGDGEWTAGGGGDDAYSAGEEEGEEEEEEERVDGDVQDREGGDAPAAAPLAAQQLLLLPPPPMPPPRPPRAPSRSTGGAAREGAERVMTFREIMKELEEEVRSFFSCTRPPRPALRRRGQPFERPSAPYPRPAAHVRGDQGLLGNEAPGSAGERRRALRGGVANEPQIQTGTVCVCGRLCSL